MTTEHLSTTLEAFKGQPNYKVFRWLLIAIGGAVCIFSAYHLLQPFGSPDALSFLDWHFLLIAIVTVGVASRISVRIPRIGGQVTVSDTFIFLIMLLYSGEAAVLLAATEAFCSSLRFSKNATTRFFNASVMACSTFLTIWSLRLCFGDLREFVYISYSPALISGILVIALVQYITNSGITAIDTALKNKHPISQTWSEYYLWTSITYLVGASAAVIIARLIVDHGFYAVLLSTPTIAIIYFTYRTYLKNIEVSVAAAQAEAAQRHFAERDRIREQYAQMEKLSALGELASGVAHNFNNTLAGILGRAQMLRLSTDPQQIKQGLDIIIRVAEDGAHTVKRIQDFARQRRDHDFDLLAVDQLLFDISEVTRPRWKDSAEANNIHINLDVQIRSKAMVMGDASELREVLVNMVFNAVDAMPQGGELRLTTKDVDGQHVEIAVSDTGTGMTEDVRSRIFDPFFTTKGKAGLGLGLAVSYGIIRRHEGAFEVDSELGRGTTFRIRLPIAKNISAAAISIEEQAARMHRLAPPPALNAVRILVIDDEDFVRDLLRDILDAEGCEVVLAADGHEALGLFEEDDFAAVFTDVGLPGMSGWELARTIRARNRRIPIAIITGWGDSVGASEQQEAQVDWVVTKPFSIDRIAELASEITLRHRHELSSALESRPNKNFATM